MCMSKKAEEPENLEKNAKYSIQALERNNDDMLNHSSGYSHEESKTPLTNPKDLHSLELTLTRRTEVGNQRVLRHSDHSAFSK